MHQVAGHLAGGGAAAEDLVHAELGRRRGVEPGAADHQQRPAAALPAGRSPAGRAGAERVGQRAGARQVRVALGDDLADQHRVRVLGHRAGYQVGHVHLGAEVHHPHLPVVLQALLACVPLDVEDRVDPDRVRVGADAGPEHHHLPAEAGPDAQVDLGGGQHRELPLRHRYLRQVHPLTLNTSGCP